MSAFDLLHIAAEVHEKLRDPPKAGWLQGRAVAAYIKPDPAPIPEGAMRVAPGADAIVWRVHPPHGGEL